MIAGATRGTGGPALVRHLTKTTGGQEVTVMASRGLSAEDISGQLRELVASAAHGRTSRPVHHVHVDPPPDCGDPDSVIKTFMRHYEREFGLENAQRAGVYHVKHGRKHAHVVWSLVNEDGSVVSLAHDHARREKVSRITEFEHGLPMTRGKHNRSAAAALRKEGRVDVADAMEAAGLLDGKRPVAHSTPRQRAQAERTGVPLDEIRRRVLAAWKASDDAKSFAVALHTWDFSVAQGERGLVLVDRSAGTHSLNRVLAAAARAAGGERITAAMVRKRISGIVFPTVEEARNAQRSRTTLERHDGDESEHGAPVAAPGIAQRVDRRDAKCDRRVESAVVRDHRDSGPPHARLVAARKRIRDRAAAQVIGGIEFQEINEARREIMKAIKARNFKADLLAKIAPRGFNAHAFSDDLRMIKMPSPRHSAARIMTNDGGWVELDSAGKTVQTWGTIGRNQILAAALATKLGCEVEHLAKSASFGADAESPRMVKLSENQIKDLAAWWTARGYTATSAPDGAWINIGRSRLHDTGNRLTVHGALTDEVIAATILKAREAWGGGLRLEGSWTQSEQDRMWIAAQRAGVEIVNCRPSAAAQAAWKREHEAASMTTRMISSARSAVAVAADIKAAAGGDLEALERLPQPLQAFIVSHLDDDQRTHLSAQGVAYIIPEMDRFHRLGADELAEFERQGKQFTPPRPRRRDPNDENTYSL